MLKAYSKQRIKPKRRRKEKGSVNRNELKWNRKERSMVRCTWVMEGEKEEEQQGEKEEGKEEENEMDEFLLSKS